MKKNTIRQPWFIRRAVYALVGVVGVLAVAFGVASPEMVDGWQELAPGIASAIGGILAALNTGPGSDTPHVAPERPDPTAEYRDRLMGR